MRASEESTEQRLARWRELRDHLRDVGLSEVPPDDLLLEPERTTRPDVPLVAYFKEIRQESLGKKTSTEILTAVLTVVLGIRVLTGFDQWFDNTEQPVTLGWLILTLAMLVFTYTVVGWVLRKTRARKDALSLTLEELSMSLPDGNLHTRWTNVYAVSVNEGRKWFSRQCPWIRRRQVPCIKVELDDGMVIRIYQCAAECELLADLMRDFVVHHRGDHTAAPGTAS